MNEIIQLFDSLDKSQSPYSDLRKVQREVLNMYSGSLTNVPRIGIKLPTGAGKSLIAILILEYWRRKGKIVAILASNKALANDLKKRCDELGIPSATIFGGESGDSKYKVDRLKNLTRYKIHALIGIFNYKSYVYGTEYKQEIAIADILIIDDASEFENTRNDFFAIRIERDDYKELYKKIINSLVETKASYSGLESFLDYSAPHDAVELVHFTDTKKVFNAIRSYRQQHDDPSPELSYALDRNRSMQESYLVFINNDGIEIRPLVIPEQNLKMSGSKQIILMSATLPTGDLLHKIYGIRNSEISMVDESNISREAMEEVETLGKRLIFPLADTELTYKVSNTCLGIIESLFLKHNKVLLLANSLADARTIETYLEKRGISAYHFKDPDDGSYFAHEVNEGILVCANRYTGLDFPGDTCKVCIIVRLPLVMDHLDAFQLTVLNNTPYMHQKIAHRLIQSFGRCNRLVTDEALYYVLDSRIIARLTGEELYLKYFPVSMRAEIQTGYYLSEGGVIAKSIEYGSSNFFGVHDQVFNDTLKDEKALHLANKTALPAMNLSFQFKEIEAWEKMLEGAYETAGQFFDFLGEQSRQSEPNQLISAFYFYLSAMAYYLAFIHFNNEQDKKMALKELEKSIEVGGHSSWFNHLRSIFNELIDDSSKKMDIDSERISARRIREAIVIKYEDFVSRNSGRNKNWKASFGERRDWINKGTHGQMLDGLMTILELFGYSVRKGDNNKNEPDLIAHSATTAEKYILSIECKTREKGEEELKESVAQTMSDAAVIERKHQDYKIYPLLITQKEEIVTHALEAAKRQVTIFRTEDIGMLLDHLFKTIESWNEQDTWEKKQEVIDHVLSSIQLSKLFMPSDEPVISTSAIREIL